MAEVENHSNKLEQETEVKIAVDKDEEPGKKMLIDEKEQESPENAENDIKKNEVSSKSVEENNSNEAANNDEQTEEKSDTDANEADNEEEEISKLEMDIIRQIEYYFGDSNLRRDKFLLEQISKESEGWVPLSVLLTFKRLASLSTDVDVIINALGKSDEGLIEISEDKTKIRRHPERPIPEYNEEVRKEIQSRTAYVKGFSLDTEMDELIDFFKPFDKVLNIGMRKYFDKPSKIHKFKGSVFVTFDNKEHCEDFLNKEKIQFKENDLIKMWQADYLNQKRKERDELAAKKKAKSKKAEPVINLPKGSVLYFEGCDENFTREDIRAAFKTLDTDVAFIEYARGDKNGHVRLQTENSAQAFIDKLEDNKLEIKSIKITFRTLEENEEKEFLTNVVGQMKSRRNNQNKNKRKRKSSEKSENEPAAKK